VELLEKGFSVVSIDNFSRSNPEIYMGIEEITGESFHSYDVDLKDKDATLKVFSEHPDIQGVIHFAAYKTVPESVFQPVMYYENNLSSLLNVISGMESIEAKHLVFSSSCSVYGNPEEIKVTEETPRKVAASPYARTKQFCEDIIQDYASQNDNMNHIMLRYFNPAGAHMSAKIGELPTQKPDNLLPFVTQTAIGIRDELSIFGNDYPTKDGTCIRDYIHVSDIANAHVYALNYLFENKNDEQVEVFNLGSGSGNSVLEVVQTFERANDLKLPYKFAPRRAGDVVAIYADNSKACSRLGWKLEKSFEDIMTSAWAWEQKLAKDK